MSKKKTRKKKPKARVSWLMALARTVAFICGIVNTDYYKLYVWLFPWFCGSFQWVQ